MANPQHAILTNLNKYQWYTHLSRTDGADLGVIKSALADLRARRDDLGLGGAGEPGVARAHRYGVDRAVQRQGRSARQGAARARLPAPGRIAGAAVCGAAAGSHHAIILIERRCPDRATVS